MSYAQQSGPRIGSRCLKPRKTGNKTGEFQAPDSFANSTPSLKFPTYQLPLILDLIKTFTINPHHRIKRYKCL